MKAKELRDLSDEELLEKERKLKEELFKLNQDRYSGKVNKPHMFKLLRKDIARIQTILRERKLKEEKYERA
ncbi:MAG: 50S ribosomal protein L29 [Candidatus Omnitrophica bacterium]|nr:50S ribosomal protein L29 [Candidatus Omnitrophota bacterium]